MATKWQPTQRSYYNEPTVSKKYSGWYIWNGGDDILQGTKKLKKTTTEKNVVEIVGVWSKP